MKLNQHIEEEIKDLQNRYSAIERIDLSDEQAIKVIGYEHQKNSGSSKYYFSVWEELDYEEVVFKEILSEEQLQSYMAERPYKLKRIEASLIDHDKSYINYLSAAKEELEYCHNILVPSLKKVLFSFPGFSEGPKIDFLKAEYKRYLADSKMQILTEHFRHFKIFQPTRLQLSLVHHKISCVLPDYFSFKATFDIATNAVAEYMLEKLSLMSEDMTRALRQEMDKLKDFNKKNSAKHIDEGPGWNLTLRDKEKREELMFAFLFEPEMYTDGTG